MNLNNSSGVLEDFINQSINSINDQIQVNNTRVVNDVQRVNQIS